MAINVQLRRGTAEEWSTVNPVLALAEMCLEIDTNLFKIGNGVATWNELPYGGIRGYTGSGVTGFTGSIGNIAVDNVLYVSKSGDDIDDGTSLNTSKLTIKSALEAATPGTTIFVKSGDYTETNPITVPDNVAVVGDSLRTVTVRPLNKTQDMFYVNNGSYVICECGQPIKKCNKEKHETSETHKSLIKCLERKKDIHCRINLEYHNILNNYKYNKNLIEKILKLKNLYNNKS